MLLLFGAGVVTAGAQSPGGVKGTELWFQTLPVTADLQGAYRWMDLAGDSVKLRSLDRSGKPGSEYTQTRSFAPAFNFHPALYLSGGSYGKTASFKFSNFSQATVFSVFALPPESHDKDMLLYSLDGRKGGGSILSKDKAVRANGTEPLDYGKDTGEDLLFSSSDRQSATDFRESSVRVLTYLRATVPERAFGEKTPYRICLSAVLIPHPIRSSAPVMMRQHSGTTVLTAIPPKSSSTDVT